MLRVGTFSWVSSLVLLALSCGGSGSAGGGDGGTGAFSFTGGKGGTGGGSTGGTGATSGVGGTSSLCDCPSSAPKCCVAANGGVSCASDTSPSSGCGGPSCDPCPTAPNANAACVTDACGFSCKSGYGDCDGNAANGCETDTSSNMTHCGACDQACTAPSGTATCTSGKCSITSCPSGSADCNKQAADGCEVDTDTSTTDCGSCGSTCDGVCVAGDCLPAKQPTLTDLATGLGYASSDQGEPCRLAVDGTNAYWVAPAGLMSVPKGGGSVSTLVSASSPTSLAFDGTDIYFSTSAGIQRVPKGGGTPISIATSPATCLALDSTYIYFTGSGGVYKVQKSATPSTETPVQIAAATGPTSINVDATDIFWVTTFSVTTSDILSKIGITGGSKTDLYSTSHMWGTTADDTAVYVAETFALRRVPKDGSATASLTSLKVASGTIYPKGVTTDGATVYVPTYDASPWALIGVPVSGGTATKLVNAQGRVGSLALDSTHLYWIDIANGALRRCER
jgi:hypothetical protein